MQTDRKEASFQPVALSLTVAAALLRLMPHPPNFAPVGGMALFGGARLKGWQAYFIPVLAMLVTDPLLSFIVGRPAYSVLTPVIYGCFLINVLLGRILLTNTVSPARIASVATLGSVIFFVVTNFFVWLTAPGFYPQTAAGLAACYTAALPFFGRTLLSDLFYSGVLFAAHLLISKRFSRIELRSTARG